MNRRFHIYLFSIFAAIMFFSCSVVFAAAPDSALGKVADAASAGRSGGVDVDGLVRTLLTLVNWFSWFVGVIAVVMGLYAGFLFITARDNATQLATARKTMLWAIIGVGAAVVTFSIIALTKGILQI